MSARVLVVDDIAANVRLLEARLMAEYFQVLTATNGPDAIEIAQQGACDIILLDVMMPGMDGFEVCKRLKKDPRTMHLPIVMVTALDQPSDKIQGLDCGADDFLTKPVNDLALITRVKSLVRLKVLSDELRMRASTGADSGVEEMIDQLFNNEDTGGRVLVVDDKPSSYERIVRHMSREHEVEVVTDAQEALFKAADSAFDLIVISVAMDDFDALRLCSQLRALDRTRLVPILLLTNPEDESVLIRGLDLGVNDYVVRPVDQNELTARIRTQIRRKRYNDHLRASVHTTMEMAIKDGLTGLNNRRYLESHMATLFDKAVMSGKSLSVIVLDIDHFKAVNDTHGHDAGDDVLREFARRMKKNVRGVDLACRFGGEEFVVVMPETDLALACIVAERTRKEIAAHPFIVSGGKKQINCTVSIGVASLEQGDQTKEELLKRADEALYSAKRAGRNRVVSEAA